MKLRSNKNLSRPVVQSFSINEDLKRNSSKTSLANNIEGPVNDMKTSAGHEAVAMVNKIEQTSMSKISSCSSIGSPELSLCKASSDMECDGKSFALPDNKGVGSQKWRNPLVGWKQVTKDTSQEKVSAISFVQTQLTSDNQYGSKLPTPLVIDMKSSKAKENINSKDEDECVVILNEVEKRKEIPVSDTKRKCDKPVHRNTNEKCEDVANDSVIIIDDSSEDPECKKRKCSMLNDSVIIVEDSKRKCRRRWLNDTVIIVEDTNRKRTRKRRNKSSPVLGISKSKGRNKEECKSLSKNEGKPLKGYESVLKKDFIPLSNCASVITYVNKHAGRPQESKKNDAVQADMLSVYVDKGKNSYNSTIFQQSTSKNMAPQQQQQQQQQPTSVGDNICSVKKSTGKQTGLRPVVIDGSNVAMGHTNGRVFSCEGLKICIDYFLERKHKVIAFVPRFRQGKCTNTDLLSVLEKRGLVTFTPSRRVDGKLLVSYDDRFIVQYAAECGGVIVSTDNFRDLLNENPNWKETIEKRLLMFTWAGDVLMFPHDPLGRGGPTLEELLRFPE